MKEVAVYEAKTRLSELLTDVEQGQEVTITRRGQAVARLVAALPATNARAAAAQHRSAVRSVFDALRVARQGVTLDMPLRDVVSQGRD